jgi:transposase-like protein
VTASKHPRSHVAAPIERPVCPKCNTTMMLARLTPGHAGFEIQSFECPKCNHQLTVEVGEVDPLKSADGWLNSELRPPE